MTRYLSRVLSTVRHRLSASARGQHQATLREQEMRERLRIKLAALRDDGTERGVTQNAVTEPVSESFPGGEFIVMASRGLQTVQSWEGHDKNWLKPSAA